MHATHVRCGQPTHTAGEPAHLTPMLPCQRTGHGIRLIQRILAEALVEDGHILPSNASDSGTCKRGYVQERATSGTRREHEPLSASSTLLPTPRRLAARIMDATREFRLPAAPPAVLLPMELEREAALAAPGALVGRATVEARVLKPRLNRDPPALTASDGLGRSAS